MPAKKKSGKKKKKDVLKETIIREYKDDPKSKAKSKKSASKTKTKKRKTTKRKTTGRKRKTTSKKASPSKNDLKLEKALIENFIGLQKVMVNLSGKFEDLSGKISKLLDLFELSAKALAEKDINVEKASENDETIIHKVDDLSDQNKVIARGLLLMNDKLEDEPGTHGMKPIPKHHLPNNPGPINQLNKSNMQQSQNTENKPNNQSQGMKGYEKSMFSSQKPQNQENKGFKKLPGK